MLKHLAATSVALALLATPAGASTVQERDRHIKKYLNKHFISEDADAWATRKRIRVTDGFAFQPHPLKAAWISAIVEVGYVKVPKPAPVVASSSTPVSAPAPTANIGAQVGVRGIICDVFGPYCSQALSVVACESGFSTAAVNGQYLGLFQMGSNERATYGHGSDAYSQARAAYAYFIASGSDWSPWACKP